MAKTTDDVTSMNIYQKLAKIRKPVEVMQKNKAGYGYKYVTEDEILANISGFMEKYNVSLIPEIVPGTAVVTPYRYEKTKMSKNNTTYTEINNEILVSADMRWVWVNNDNPDDRIVVPWALVGQQADASQAFGSGLSYSSRYFMLKYFNIATSEDDVEQWRKKQKEAENKEQAEVAKAIIEQAHDLVLKHVEKLPNDREFIYGITKKYAKDSKGKPTYNYMEIKDPVVAGDFMKELSEALKAKEEEHKK